MFDISSWGQRIVDENELEGARWRWELYQGEEGRQHDELDRQMAQVRTWASSVAESLKAIAPALQDAFAQVAEAIGPMAKAFNQVVHDLAEYSATHFPHLIERKTNDADTQGAEKETG